MNRLLLLLFLLFLGSCNREKPTTTEYNGVAMTVPYKIIIGKNLTDAEEERVSTLITKTFEEVDAVFNKWNPESELSQLNQLPSGKVVEISPGLEALLKTTGEIVALTQGRFDPTVEPMHALWKSHLSQGQKPSEDALKAIKPLIGWDKIHFGNGRFYKDESGVMLDLGGIAKGHAVDLLAARIAKAGFPDLLVEWGGEFSACGDHPSKRPWTIFISAMGNPDPKNAIAIVPLKDQAIATSGDYLQKWTITEGDADISFSHIVDPRTGVPLEITEASIASASVLAKNCAFADGLATAAMLFPNADEAHAWSHEIMKKYPDVRFWIVAHGD